MSESKNLQHQGMERLMKDFSGRVTILGTYQDSGANIEFDGRKALFIFHGAATPRLPIRIKRNRGYSLYDTWIKNGHHLDIDIVISMYYGYGRIPVYEVIDWSAINNQLERFFKNPDNYKQDIISYQDGNEAVVFDRMLAQKFWRLNPQEILNVPN